MKKIAYKATYNMKCKSITYEVGGEYKTPEISMCIWGFHYCYDMADTLNYYDFTKDFVLLEIENLGNEIRGNDKYCSDHIKVIRIVPPDEYTEEFKKNLPVFEYDSHGNITKKISPSGCVWKYEYDSHGNMAKMFYSNGRDRKHEYEYDSHGNMTKEIDSDGRESKYEYDSHGNITKEIDHDGREWNWKSDSRGNMAKKIFSDVMERAIEII